MERIFFNLCSDDPVCAVNIPAWREAFNSWTTPSDSGWCIHIVSGKSFEVDQDNPFPFVGENGKLKTWNEVIDSAAQFPIKESWSPFKTWIQTNCRKTRKCGKIGNWESTIKRFDGKAMK